MSLPKSSFRPVSPGACANTAQHASRWRTGISRDILCVQFTAPAYETDECSLFNLRVADKRGMDVQRRSAVPLEGRFDQPFTLLHVIVAGQSLSHAEAVAAFRRLYAREPTADVRLLRFMKEG